MGMGGGGLRMINFKLFVKTQRIMWFETSVVMDKRTVGGNCIFDYCFRSVGGRFFFVCDYESSKVKLTVPLFYLEVVKAWQDLEKCRNFESGVMNPILFNNKNYMYKRKNYL